MPENYRDQLGHGLAAYLAAAGLLAWRPAYDYPIDTVWPTYVQQDAPPSPHALVHIAVGVQMPERRDTLTMIQVRVRGDQDAPDEVAGDKMQQIIDVLTPNGYPLVSASLGGVRVGMVAAGPTTPLGRDQQRRLSLVTNFRIRSRRVVGATTPPAGSLYGAGVYGEGLYGA